MKLLNLCSVASLLSSVAAFREGTGSCNAGTGAILLPGFSHAESMQVGGTDLASFNISVSLNGEVLDPATPKDFLVGKPHTLALTASGEAFRGFLVRIENEAGADTTEALGPLEPMDGDIKVARLCVDVNQVGGVDHTDRDDKKEVKAFLEMEQPAADLIMDVTVCIRHSEALNISQWYFSSYTLNAISPTDYPSRSPSEPPMGSPSTIMPAAPTEQPTTSGSSPFTLFTVVAVIVGAALVGIL